MIITFSGSNFSKIFKFYFPFKILRRSNPSSIILKLSKLIRLLFIHTFLKFAKNPISPILILKSYKILFVRSSPPFLTPLGRIRTIFPEAWPRNQNDSDLSISVRFRAETGGCRPRQAELSKRFRSIARSFEQRAISLSNVFLFWCRVCRTGVIGGRLSSVTRVIVDSSRATG